MRSVFPWTHTGVSVRDPEHTRRNLDHVLNAKQKLMTQEKNQQQKVTHTDRQVGTDNTFDST